MLDTFDTTAVQPRPSLHRPGFARELVETLILIVAIYALVNLASVRFFIDGPSMQPNFFANQFLLVSRLAYMFGQPERGDIVVFNAPGSAPNDPPLIKRAIGLPGDTVTIKDDQVYINGTQLNETYTKEACIPSRCPDKEWKLGSNEYFFMGDNRNNSRDSRVFGPVTGDRIVGEAIIRYWPPSDAGIVTDYRYPRP